MPNNTLKGANMTISILRLPQVKARTGMSRSSIYAAVKEGNFPTAVSLGSRAVGWLDSSITEWIESRPPAGGAATVSVQRKDAATTQAAVRTKAPAAAPSVSNDGQPVAELGRTQGVAR